MSAQDPAIRLFEKRNFKIIFVNEFAGDNGNTDSFVVMANRANNAFVYFDTYGDRVDKCNLLLNSMMPYDSVEVHPGGCAVINHEKDTFALFSCDGEDLSHTLDDALEISEFESMQDFVLSNSIRVKDIRDRARANGYKKVYTSHIVGSVSTCVSKYDYLDRLYQIIPWIDMSPYRLCSWKDWHEFDYHDDSTIREMHRLRFKEIPKEFYPVSYNNLHSVTLK